MRLLALLALLATPQLVAAAPQPDLRPASGNVTVYFLNDGVPYFSRKLRGEMMADEVRKQRPGWKVYWTSYEDFDAQIPRIQRTMSKDAGIVCLFVKTHDDNLAKRCRHELHATVLIDTVDNMRFLHHADDAEFLRKHYLDGVIVQTTKKAEEARQRNLDVFYIPHHHTNLASLHRSPHSFKAAPRTIGFLCGSTKNLPSEKEQYAIARATCSFGASFVVIEQGRTLPLTTTVTRFQCVDRTVTVTQEVSTDRKQPNASTDDPYEQLPFHQHPIFQEVDLAILWPPSFGDDWTELRPPTRLLFWMSHGVPVLFYPYTSYVEFAEKHDYYGKCLQRDEPALQQFLRVTDSKRALPLVLKRLMDPEQAELRECLSAQGVNVASHYSPAAMGHEFAEVLNSMARRA